MFHDLTENEPQNPALLTNSLVAEHGGQIIAEMRTSDGYINATKMCASGGKHWAHYWRSDGAQAFVQALASNVQKRMLDLVISQRGGDHSGTWVHHRVAIHLAMWISPEFAVAVTNLVERYLTGRITTIESQEAAQSASNALVLRTNNIELAAIESAGFNKNVLGNQLYFGIPGNKLVFEKSLDGGFGVKFGITREGNERNRFKDHVAEYGGFRLLDCLQCKYPDLLETKIKHMVKIQSRQVFGKAENKTYRDTELVFVRDQEEYNDLVYAAKELVDSINQQENDQIEIILAKEKTIQAEELTKQEQERTKQSETHERIRHAEELTKQEREKTRQLELQLEILRIQSLQTNTTTNTPPSSDNMEVDEAPTYQVQQRYTAADPIPLLVDPIGLTECYQQWLQIKDYFICVPQPPWKEKFGANAAQHKLRYSRMRPFLQYMDKYGTTPDSVSEIIQKLDDIRLELRLTPSAFVKQCFYMLYHPSPSVENKLPITRNDMLQLMHTRRLPIDVNRF
jgi:hypothetical protein